MWRTLRFRLSAWNTLVVLAAVIATLVAVREGVRVALIREIDRLLEEDTLELALAVRSLYPDQEAIHVEMNRKAQGHVDRRLFVQLLDAEGRVAWSSLGTPPHFERRDRRVAVGGTNLIRHLTGEGYLAVERALREPGLPAMSIRVGCSDEHVRQDLRRLTAAMLLVGLAVLVAAPLGGYWLAGRATSPLAEINRTAAELHPAQLAERLPDRGTGDELDHLSRTINGLLDRLAAYVGRNQDFLANAAHELRSPLAAIRSSAEVALTCPRSSEEYQELLAEIVDDCGQLSALVNQLLLLAESDAGELHADLEYVDWDQVVARAAEMFQGVAEERGVALRINPLPEVRVRGDARRLRQVVNNLLDNAIKYTPSGGSVTVTLRRDDSRRKAELTVQDTGAGIAAADLPHVFERFYRGDRSRQRRLAQHGTGLGLAICRALVEAHRGEITLESRPGAGTMLRVVLPVADEALGDENEV